MKRNLVEIPFRSVLSWRGDCLACPQALSGDIFCGCNLGCRWFCFCREMEAELYSKYYSGWHSDLIRVANPDEFKRWFDRAFGSDRPSNNWLVRCLRYGLPVTLGGKSEPFLDLRASEVEKVLELFVEYGVPVIVNTKTVWAGLSRYFGLLKRMSACAVIVSIMGGSDSLVYRLEPGLPVASQRWQLVEELNRQGIWCGVRWEPILGGINDGEEALEDFAKKAHRYGAKHVSFYPYRSSNYRLAKKEFESRGFNYRKVLEGALDENWRKIGSLFFGLLRRYGVRASSPDFVNFPFDSDCESCCGTDGVVKSYPFTFQRACLEIKRKGWVGWEDMERIEFRHPKFYNLAKTYWNGGGGIFTLADSSAVKVLDRDRNGMNIYGRKEESNGEDVGFGLEQVR